MKSYIEEQVEGRTEKHSGVTKNKSQTTAHSVAIIIDPLSVQSPIRPHPSLTPSVSKLISTIATE